MNPLMLRDLVLRRHFPAFIEKVFHTLSPGRPYRPNWHIDTIAHHLTEVMAGRSTRLLITLPPRSLKSICTSVAFPAFVLGHTPGARIICVSYSDELARALSRQFRLVIESAWYRALFPGTIICKNAEIEIVTSAQGMRLATSVGGTLTGRGGNIIIIDDPLNANNATSEAERNRIIAWYRETLLSRLDHKHTGAIIVVMQRLHEEDLAGYLIETGTFQLLTMPAIAVEDEVWPLGMGRFHRRTVGEVLHPAQESLAGLMALKAQMGSMLFSAQYQQQPVPADGNLFHRHWIGRYDEPSAPANGARIIHSWDVASSMSVRADYSVCTRWLLAPNERYHLLEVVRGRWEYPELLARATELARADNPEMVLIEDASNGTALLQSLAEGATYNLLGIKPRLDKWARASKATAEFEAGRVLFPVDAPWLAEVTHELFAFPHGRYDDQVDSISQFLQWAAERRAIPPEPHVAPGGDYRESPWDMGDGRWGLSGWL